MLYKVAVLATICAAVVARKNEVRRIATKRNHITGPRPQDYIKSSALPTFWDWRNISGTSYVTPNLNQHIPVYCGSCWAHGSSSAFADRIKILRNATYPDIQPSIQVILNCAQDSAGTCSGGDDVGVYQYFQQTGIPDITCQQYQAVDKDCTAINTCMTCSPDTGCAAVTKYKSWFADQYGEINGESSMMAEIYARGPISCGIDAGPILNYTGGIFYDHTGAASIDHIISVVGWGEGDDGTGNIIPYWVVRNSWGTYWGEAGWMRIIRGVDNLAIEEDCAWVTPKHDW